ncbi:hypothetical protein EVA_02236 [gut metagenome]|uniref:Uncharacterized protein n=1 Tax=gut metagenome TaxID=749906 RepID=J9GNI2_9ZZZZ
MLGRSLRLPYFDLMVEFVSKIKAFLSILLNCRRISKCLQMN